MRGRLLSFEGFVPVLILAVSAIGVAAGQNEYAYDKAPICYSDTEAKDPVAELEQAMAAGKLKFEGSPREQVGHLLKMLDIPASSQVLVFSKTSVQDDRINPRNPRAIYFSDTSYVGWVPGGRVEVASIDAQLGPVFYSYDPANHPPRQPRFVRESDCLRCHGTFFTGRVPSVFVRSVFVDDRGFPVPRASSMVVDHTVPFEDRWAGWYVTGHHGKGRHLGNMFASEGDDGPVFSRESGANVTELAKFCDVRPYLSTGSDIVALMVLEHQSAAQTALTRADYAAREALHDQRRLDNPTGASLGRPRGEFIERFGKAAELVLDALLFRSEAALPDGGVQGDRAFQSDFIRHARRAANGASLKDFDLHGRLFRYRCSYMIYSPSFQNLEPFLRQMVLEKLKAVLTDSPPDDRYNYLPPSERAAIRSILTQTFEGWSQDG